MAALSDKALKTNYSENKYRYNSGSELQNKEFNDGTGLEMYEMAYRGLDPQLGRFTSIDPQANSTPYLNPYQFADDKPESSNDPSGAKAQMIKKWIGQLAPGVGANINGSVGADASFLPPGDGGGGDDSGDGDGSVGGDGSCSVATYNNYWSTVISYLMGQPSGTGWNCSDELTGTGLGVSDQSLSASQSGTDPSITLDGGNIGIAGNMNASFLVSGVNATSLQAIQIFYGSPILDKGQSAPGIPAPYIDDCSVFYGFVDGGVNSPYAASEGHPAVTGQPYYIAPNDPDGSFVSWDPATQSGGVIIFDGANATTITNSTRFEVYIIATNYNNSGHDQILGSFTWGYSNSGTSSVTGNQVIFSPGNCISPVAQYILSNNYPNYKFYGN
jgi:RHS repeat-associated protein